MARWLLRTVVVQREREAAAAELAEAYRTRAATMGTRAAGRWYWRQVAGFVVRARLVSAKHETGRGGMGWLDDLMRDTRWAVRSLRRRPVFTAVGVSTLALGIGANSAIFTLLSAHFLAPLPYAQPDEIVLLWETDRNSPDVTTVAPGNYFTWREQTSSFADIAAFNVDHATLSGSEGPAERVTASLVAPHFFDVLGVGPEVGTGFDDRSAREADGKLVVLSHGLWVRRYGGNPAIVGTDVRVDGHLYTVVGVMPAAFRQPERSLTFQATELWRPDLLEGSHDDFDSRYLRTVARLRPGVTVEQARQEMNAVAGRMAEAHPSENGGRAIVVRTLDDYLLGEARPALLMLVAAGATVFLIVCANVANLTLARGQERRRELAVRAALGAGRRRLVRQLLVEGVILALAGATLGTALVFAAHDGLQAVQARYFSGLTDAPVDLRVVMFATLAALGAAVLFSVPLARSASGAEIHDALVQGGERTGGARGAAATRSLLVVGQVGLATFLLVVASLLIRSFAALVSVPPGFSPDGVLTFTVSAPPERAGAEGVLSYYREVWDELDRVPGVTAVSMASDLPFTLENRWTELGFPGRKVDPNDPPRAEYHVVTPEYFRVMGIPLLAGALPDAAWEWRTPMPVLVNLDMARRFWPGRDAVGATFVLQWDDPVPLTVVAIVGNVLDDGFTGTPEPIFYAPFGSMVNRRMTLVAKVIGSPAGVVGEVREAVARVSPEVPVSDLRMMSDLLAETVARPRAAFLFSTAFALIALLVAAAGIYAVLSYSVQSRTREIGIRSALGARGNELVGMLLGHAARLLVLGLALGSVGALLAGRLLSSLLFGVPAWDPVSLVGAMSVLGAVGTLAAWLPARRAVRVDPRAALRSD